MSIASSSKTGWTPGPWTFGSNGRKHWVNGPDNDGAERVADCGPDEADSLGWTPQAHQEANARLIAAAPELFEALEDCLQSLKRLDDQEGAFRVTCIQQACAALDKARRSREAKGCY